MQKELTVQFAEARKGIRRDTIWVGIGSFIAGGALTFAITLLAYPLH